MSYSQSGKCYYTAEEKQAALSNNNPLAYALARGYPLVKQGSYYKMKDHDSMVFSPSGYFAWNSHGIIHGDALDFIQKYENRSFAEAICILAGTINSPPPMKRDVILPKAEERKALVLPEKAEDYRAVFAYLTKTRGISQQLVKQLVEEGKVYQDKAHGNLVMVGYDENQIARYASIRSTNTFLPKPIKIDATGSDKRYPFVIEGKPDADTVCVLESPIEVMSYHCLCKEMQSVRVHFPMISLGGAASLLSLERYLKEHPQIKNIVVGLNNDSHDFDHAVNAGRNGTQRIMEKFGSSYGISVHTPHLNDWNDVLKNYRAKLEPHLQAAQNKLSQDKSRAQEPARSRPPQPTL